MNAPTSFLAVFLGGLSFATTKEERAEGFTVPTWALENATIGGFTVAPGAVPEGHGLVTLEPSPAARQFATRGEAEAFCEAQAVRRSGWQVMPVMGRA